jgi:hypothetical protein
MALAMLRPSFGRQDAAYSQDAPQTFVRPGDESDTPAERMPPAASRAVESRASDARAVGEPPASAAVCLANGLRVRSGPNLESQIVSRLHSGEEVYVLAASDWTEAINGYDAPWYMVLKHDGKTGWAYGGYLEIAAEPGQFFLGVLEQEPEREGGLSEYDLEVSDWSAPGAARTLAYVRVERRVRDSRAGRYGTERSHVVFARGAGLRPLVAYTGVTGSIRSSRTLDSSLYPIELAGDQRPEICIIWGAFDISTGGRSNGLEVFAIPNGAERYSLAARLGAESPHLAGHYGYFDRRRPESIVEEGVRKLRVLREVVLEYVPTYSKDQAAGGQPIGFRIEQVFELRDGELVLVRSMPSDSWGSIDREPADYSLRHKEALFGSTDHGEILTWMIDSFRIRGRQALWRLRISKAGGTGSLRVTRSDGGMVRYRQTTCPVEVQPYVKLEGSDLQVPADSYTVNAGEEAWLDIVTSTLDSNDLAQLASDHEEIMVFFERTDQLTIYRDWAPVQDQVALELTIGGVPIEFVPDYH